MGELREFVQAVPVAPSQGLSDSILSRVHRDLHPSFLALFLKLSAIHAIVGGVTLAFCPQFGLGLTAGMGLMGFFMRWGEQACMVGCGAVFMGGSLLIASLVLRPEEVRAIRKTELLQVGMLALLSIGSFVCTGAAVVVSLGLFWILGSIVGGLGTLELGWAFRRQILLRSGLG